MRKVLNKKPERAFTRPDGLTTAKLCSQSGGLATEFCPKPTSALVIAAHVPEACELHTEPVQVKLPRLVGLPKEDALARIETLKLKAKVVEKQVSGVAAGIVAEQSPAPGALVKAGSQVTLVVSAGASADAPPKAAFTVTGSPKAGKPVSLDGSESTDDGTIASYYWEFGDGQTATGKSPSHTWAAPGTYEVTLWVTDNSGQQGSVTKSIAVK